MAKKKRKANKKEQVHQYSKLKILLYILEFVIACAYILFTPVRHSTLHGIIRVSLYQTIINDPDQGIVYIAILIIAFAVYICIRFLKKQM